MLIAGEGNGVHEAHMNGNGVKHHNGTNGDVAVEVDGREEVQVRDLHSDLSCLLSQGVRDPRVHCTSWLSSSRQPLYIDAFS